MKFFVIECGLPVRKAAREVRKLTNGAVTDSRASNVYRERAGLKNRGVSSDAPAPPEPKEPQENQEVATEPDSAADFS